MLLGHNVKNTVTVIGDDGALSLELKKSTLYEIKKDFQEPASAHAGSYFLVNCERLC